ncbi:AMP-binding protein, partial [Paraburkholderia aspalathi]|nr:AMP-binding protein [Paraburkholderia aspalathi]
MQSIQANADQPLWQPDAARIAASNLSAFAKQAEAASGQVFSHYAALHQWSIDDRAGFWSLIWEFCDVIGKRGDTVLIDDGRMWEATFFPKARLNFAENLLRKRGAGEALVFRGEDKVERRLTWDELRAQVSRLQQLMRAEGVVAGDRVAGMMPNMPEAIIAMLAAASIGAVWSSCSPDFGVQGVLDRF